MDRGLGEGVDRLLCAEVGASRELGELRRVGLERVGGWLGEFRDELRPCGTLGATVSSTESLSAGAGGELADTLACLQEQREGRMPSR
jgi:hypothetical protein